MVAVPVIGLVECLVVVRLLLRLRRRDMREGRVVVVRVVGILMYIGRVMFDKMLGRVVLGWV